MRLLAHLTLASDFPGTRLIQRISSAAGLAITLIAVAGCGTSRPPGTGTPLLDLKSSSFQTGAIPKLFTCDGEDKSPALAWGTPPPETQTWALTVVDIDAPVGSFVHWVAYNLPARTRELPEGLPKQEQLADASRQGMNDFDKIGYGGPCPPGKAPHRYVFSLYAVDTTLNLPANATRKQLENALQGHVLAHGEFTARYQR
jgi:Raf kinase inhibitor-like YbhB/YbcL family protein